MDSRVPVLVQMHVDCGRCGYTADETYEFAMPFSKAKPMESCESGECPECGAPVLMHLKRTQQRQ
jgi:ribosomal protein S27AE